MALEPEPCIGCLRTDWITRVYVRGVGWICGRCARQGATEMVESKPKKDGPP